MNKHTWLAATLAVFVVAPGHAVAQQITEGWRASVTPYLWISDYEGEVTDRVSGHRFDTEASFGDLLSDLEFAFIAKGEVQYRRTGVLADVIYLKLEADQTVQRPLLGPVRRKAEVETTTATVATFFRVVESEQWNVDLLGGLRYVKVSVDVSVQAVGPGLERETSGSFTDPVVGVRATRRIGPRSSLTAYGDIGAFTDSRTVWQLYGAYNYNVRPNLMLSAGYRHFEIDLERQRTDVDVTLKGPLLGLTYVF